MSELDTGVNELVRPNTGEVFIYAVTSTYDQRDQVTDQGFGHSSQLAQPRTETAYFWLGKLHPAQGQPVDPEYGGSRYMAEQIESLVDNLYQQEQGHPGKYTVVREFNEGQLAFIRGDLGSNTTVRSLNQDEWNAFKGRFNTNLEKESRGSV